MSARVATASATNLSTTLLVLRLGLGVIMAVHGYQKLFDMGIGAVTEGFVGMDVPLAQIAAPLVSVLEFAGGIALLIGVLTRIVAVLLAIDMIGAMVLVHFPNGFFLPSGYEFVLILFCVSVALALAGPGGYSVDAAIAERRARA